jgi:hypothetical protein
VIFNGKTETLFGPFEAGRELPVMTAGAAEATLNPAVKDAGHE